MGVRHLQSLMTRADKQAGLYVEVSILEECRKFKRNNNGQKPTLVFDLMGMPHLINKNLVEMLYGGRHNKYKEMISNLFKALSDEADLVFFEDGPVVQEKYDTWIKRKNENFQNQMEVIDQVYNQIPIHEIVEKNHNIPRTTFHLELIEEVAKTYGTLIVTVTKECDAEIARYASKNPNVLAVLADDTDFLIFPGNWRYFSIRQINIGTLTTGVRTQEFGRTALRQYLGLNNLQMYILSTIAGNDIIQYDDVKTCHQRNFNHQVPRKFLVMARMIREEIDLRNFNDVCYNLANFLLDDVSPAATQRIHDSLKQYDLNFDPMVHEDPLLNLCRTRHYYSVYAILQGMPQNFTLCFFDMRRDDSPNFFMMSTCLSQRLFGIVMQHRKRQGEIIQIQSYGKRSINESYRQHILMPIYPDIAVPPLMQLLDREQYPEHDDVRFQLLKWTISSSLMDVDITDIPVAFLRYVLTLYFMVKSGLITVWEADLFLLVVKHVELNIIPENLIAPPIVDERAFRINFLFCQSFGMLKNSLKTTGLNHLKKVLNIDGVFFHKTYLDFKGSGHDPANLLRDIDQYRIYDRRV